MAAREPAKGPSDVVVVAGGGDARASRVRARRAFALGLAVLAALAAGQAGGPVAASAATAATSRASCDGAHALRGTFLQLTRDAALRPREQWERLFADMAQVGIAQVLVQWTLADGVAFYARTPAGPDDAPVLDVLFELAERHGMRLWLGLAHDAGWWAGIDRSRPATDVEVFLARRRVANLEVARALAPQVSSRATFAGWYVPDEIDDKNWLGADRGPLVADYLGRVAGELALLAPGTPVAVSGFAQGWATPQQVVELWSAILDRAPVGPVLFQDGVGAGKLTLDELGFYLPLLRTAVDARGRTLGVVVELFTQATSPAADAVASFAAVPAPLARVQRQLAIAERWASGPVVAFSVPDYMSDFGGAAAADLYGAYRRWADGCSRRAR